MQVMTATTVRRVAIRPPVVTTFAGLASLANAPAVATGNVMVDSSLAGMWPG
jgi:hypothetical protein